MLKSHFLIATVLFLVGCGSSEQLKDKAEQKQQGYLLIGQGGGISGAYEEYLLYADGNVDVWDEEGKKTTHKGKLSQKETETIFEAWALLKKDTNPPFKPGNMNYRISYIGESGNETIRWSDSQNMGSEILGFYQSTYRSVRNAE